MKFCFTVTANHFFTFHWSESVFLFPLAFLGGLGGSGSQLNVVKLTASDGLPSKQLHMAWTLRKSKVFNQGFHRLLTEIKANRVVPTWHDSLSLVEGLLQLQKALPHWKTKDFRLIFCCCCVVIPMISVSSHSPVLALVFSIFSSNRDGDLKAEGIWEGRVILCALFTLGPGGFTPGDECSSGLDVRHLALNKFSASLMKNL